MESAPAFPIFFSTSAAHPSSLLPETEASSISESFKLSAPSVRVSGFFKAAHANSHAATTSSRPYSAVFVGVHKIERLFVEVQPARRAAQGGPKLHVELPDGSYVASPFNQRLVCTPRLEKSPIISLCFFKTHIFYLNFSGAADFHNAPNLRQSLRAQSSTAECPQILEVWNLS